MSSGSSPFLSSSTGGAGNTTGGGGGGNTGNSLTETLSGFATKVFSSAAMSAAKDQAMQLKTQAQDGDNSLKALALVGGIASIVVAIFEIIREILSFNPIGAIIEIYTLFIGIIVIVLEGKNKLLPVTYVNRIHKYALFLKFLWGRGCLYFVAGTLMIFQIDFWNFIVGTYMCLIGILYVVVGHQTASKLRSLRKNMYTEHQLLQQFVTAAGGNEHYEDGLNIQQFKQLCISLGLDMNRRETEAAFYHIRNKSSSSSSTRNTANDDTGGKMTFQEFYEWWSSSETDGTSDDLDSSAFVFV